MNSRAESQSISNYVPVLCTVCNSIIETSDTAMEKLRCSCGADSSTIHLASIMLEMIDGGTSSALSKVSKDLESVLVISDNRPIVTQLSKVRNVQQISLREIAENTVGFDFNLALYRALSKQAANSQSLVVMDNTIRFFPDLTQVFSQLHKVLAAHGRFVIRDFFNWRLPHVTEEYVAYEKGSFLFIRGEKTTKIGGQMVPICRNPGQDIFDEIRTAGFHPFGSRAHCLHPYRYRSLIVGGIKKT